MYRVGEILGSRDRKLIKQLPRLLVFSVCFLFYTCNIIFFKVINNTNLTICPKTYLLFTKKNGKTLFVPEYFTVPFRNNENQFDRPSSQDFTFFKFTS